MRWYPGVQPLQDEALVLLRHTPALHDPFGDEVEDAFLVSQHGNILCIDCHRLPPWSRFQSSFDQRSAFRQIGYAAAMVVCRVGVEDIEPGHWIAWVLDLPGCYSAAATPDGAITGTAGAIGEFARWKRQHGRDRAHGGEAVDLQVVEVFHAFASDADYLVNAFFEDDRRPLTTQEVAEGLWLLACTRADLMAVLECRDTAALTVAETAVLEHLANAEWWYLSLLDLVDRADALPVDAIARLQAVRERTRTALPALVGDGRIVERHGERWSDRKLLRRTIWHERDHTQQLRQLTPGTSATIAKTPDGTSGGYAGTGSTRQ